MALPNILRVGKRIQTRLTNILLALILSLSSLAGFPLFLSQNAYAANVSVCASGCSYTTIQDAVSGAQAGDIITLADGSYTLSSTLYLTKPLTIVGTSEAGTVINATGVASGYGVSTNADNVTLRNLTINGPTNSSGYGLKIEGSSNVVIENVTTTGSYRTGIDLNGVNNAVLNNITSTNAAHGNGVGVTDSQNVTINSVTTSGNAWGGIALYATGSYYPCGTDNFTLTGTNSLGDPGALYTGIDNTSNPACTITNLHISPADLPYKVTLNNSDPQTIYTTDLVSAGLVSAIYSPFSPVVSASNDSTNLWVTPVQTIQNVLASATAGDTINVPAGDYSASGTVTVNKAVAILGAQAGVPAADTLSSAARSGSESIVSKFLITTSGVTINGFTLTNSDTSGQVQVLSASTLSGLNVENNIFSGYSNVALPTNGAGNIVIQHNLFTAPVASAEAIQIKTSGNAGDCSGTQVLDNVFTAATTNGAADINLSCTGSSSSNVTVSGNRSMNATDPNGPNMVAFSGITGGIVVSGNTASTSGSSIFFYGSLSGSANITNNTLSSTSGSAVTIYGGDYPWVHTSDTPNTGAFTIKDNILTSSFGVHLSASALSGSGSVNAALNYWGSATPDFSTLVSNGVATSPYFTNAALTTRSDAKILPDSNGNATVDNTTPEVVVSSPTQPISVSVTAGTTGAGVDFSALVSGNTGVIPQTTITTTNASVSLAASTTVTASGSWNGTIIAPTVKNNASVSVPTPSGQVTTVATVIDVGSSSVSLSFDKAARLVLPGQTGKLVGFVPAGGSFSAITLTCGADDQSTVDAQLSALSKNECRYDNGTDMIVWTKHFTTFVAYSQAAQPAGPSSSSTSTSTSSPTPAAKTAATSSQTSNSNSSNSGSSDNGEVLGASTQAPAKTSTLSTKSTQPSNALAFQPPTKSAGKFLGLAWYFWLLGVVALAAAAYLSYAYKSVDKN